MNHIIISVTTFYSILFHLWTLPITVFVGVLFVYMKPVTRAFHCIRVCVRTYNNTRSCNPPVCYLRLLKVSSYILFPLAFDLNYIN